VKHFETGLKIPQRTLAVRNGEQTLVGVIIDRGRTDAFEAVTPNKRTLGKHFASRAAAALALERHATKLQRKAGGAS